MLFPTSCHVPSDLSSAFLKMVGIADALDAECDWAMAETVIAAAYLRAGVRYDDVQSLADAA